MGVTAAYLLAAAADEKTDLNIPRFDGGTALHAAAALLQQSNLPSAERGKVKEAVRAILQRGGMVRKCVSCMYPLPSVSYLVPHARLF